MITKIKEWGNSQGLRLNKHILSDVGISVGDDVDVKINAGIITISPVKSPRKKYNLQELVARIPVDYENSEVEWGERVGKEAW